MKSNSLVLTSLLATFSIGVMVLDANTHPISEREVISLRMEQDDQASLEVDDQEMVSLEIADLNKSAVVENSDGDRSESDLNGSSKKRQPLTLEYALVAAKSGDMLAAENTYRKILKYNPNHQAAAINLGLLLKKDNQFEEAINVLSPMVSRATGRRKGKTLAILADAHFNLGAFNIAADMLQKSIEYRPTHKLTWEKLANAQQKSKRPWYQVNKTYRQAIALNPKKKRLLLASAEYEFSALNPKGCIKQIKEHYKYLAKTDRARELLAWSYLLTNKIRKAKFHLNWLMLNGENSKRESYFKILSRLNDKSIASLAMSERLHQFIHVEPYLAPYLEMSELKSFEDTSTGLENILKRYQALLDGGAYPVEIAQYASDVAKKLNDRDQAFSLLDKAIAIHPKKASLRRKRVQLHLDFYEIDDARVEMESIYREGKRSNENRRLLAKVYMKENRFLDVIDLIKGINQSQRDEQDYLLLANAQASLERFKQSNKSLITLLEFNGKNAEGRYLYAENLCKINKVDACKKQLSLLFKLNRKHEKAIYLARKINMDYEVI